MDNSIGYNFKNLVKIALQENKFLFTITEIATESEETFELDFGELDLRSNIDTFVQKCKLLSPEYVKTIDTDIDRKFREKFLSADIYLDILTLSSKITADEISFLQDKLQSSKIYFQNEFQENENIRLFLFFRYVFDLRGIISFNDDVLWIVFDKTPDADKRVSSNVIATGNILGDTNAKEIYILDSQVHFYHLAEGFGVKLSLDGSRIDSLESNIFGVNFSKNTTVIFDSVKLNLDHFDVNEYTLVSKLEKKLSFNNSVYTKVGKRLNYNKFGFKSNLEVKYEYPFSFDIDNSVALGDNVKKGQVIATFRDTQVLEVYDLTEFCEGRTLDDILPFLKVMNGEIVEKGMVLVSMKNIAKTKKLHSNFRGRVEIVDDENGSKMYIYSPYKYFNILAPIDGVLSKVVPNVSIYFKVYSRELIPFFTNLNLEYSDKFAISREVIPNEKNAILSTLNNFEEMSEKLLRGDRVYVFYNLPLSSIVYLFQQDIKFIVINTVGRNIMPDNVIELFKKYKTLLIKDKMIYTY